MALDHDRARDLQAEADAIEFRLKMADEAIRQNAMLRHTLNERIAEAKRARYAVSPNAPAVDHLKGRVRAYEDVLSLLGPEPAWTADEEGNPF